ncbi:MAG TPA: HNH endonuclease [Spirochaetia bacterium]|nr:HNH endonuclease [Spirochaetia bacterium]
MKFYVGVTDNAWYGYLASLRPDEVNFWQPGGRQIFKAIEPQEMFLFKLHSPLNYIVGGGFFVRHYFLPVSLAWDAFGKNNGTEDEASFLQAIYKYKHTNRTSEPDPVIGCIILAAPFFFEQSDWIPVPDDWNRNIVQGKSYDTLTLTGRRLFDRVQENLDNLKYSVQEGNIIAEPGARYGSKQIVRPRLGQGAFRVIVTEAYHRRCAISGERTLPVLEAIHIKPFSREGPHLANNGLLLRKDLHALFDRGYITVSDDLHIEVSERIKKDFGNGRDYYAFHGRRLVESPDDPQDRPCSTFLRWHKENVFLA